MNSLLPILLAFALSSTGMGSYPLGILWSEESFERKLEEKLVFEQTVIREIENQGLQEVMRSPHPLRLSNELIENEKRVGEKSIAQLSPQLFGPEIESVYLSKAWKDWVLGQKEGARKWLAKAIDVNPFWDPNLLIPEGEKVEYHLFETEVARILNLRRTTPNCSIQLNLNPEDSVWINGYSVSERIFQVKQGLYLALMRNSKSQLFERILRCGGENKELNQTGWIPIKAAIPRLEMMLPPEWEKIVEVVVLQEVNGKVLKWAYQRRRGLTDWKPLVRSNWERASLVHDPISLLEASATRQEKKWYTIPKVLGWVAGIVGTGFLIRQAFDHPDPPKSIPLVLK